MIVRNELELLVPHKGRMFLLDRVLSWDLEAGGLSAEAETSEGDVFFDAALGLVPIWVSFEFVAQSIAALSGIRRRETDGSEPKVGFIMGVRGFTAASRGFPPSSRVGIEIKQLYKDGNVVSFEGIVGRGGGVEARMIVNAIEMPMDAAGVEK